MWVLRICFILFCLSACNPKTEKVPEPVLQVPNKKLEAELKTFVDTDPILIALQVVDVDFLFNTRSTIWVYSNIPALNIAFENFTREESKIGNTPWMMRSAEININQISLIEGKVNCSPVESTQLYQNVPEITQHVRFTCIMGIPPVYGEFSGYLSALLNRAPTAEELPQLIGKLRELSVKLGTVQ